MGEISTRAQRTETSVAELFANFVQQISCVAHFGYSIPSIVPISNFRDR